MDTTPVYQPATDADFADQGTPDASTSTADLSGNTVSAAPTDPTLPADLSVPSTPAVPVGAAAQTYQPALSSDGSNPETDGEIPQPNAGPQTPTYQPVTDQDFAEPSTGDKIKHAAKSVSDIVGSAADDLVRPFASQAGIDAAPHATQAAIAAYKSASQKIEGSSMSPVMAAADLALGGDPSKEAPLDLASRAGSAASAFAGEVDKGANDVAALGTKIAGVAPLIADQVVSMAKGAPTTTAYDWWAKSYITPSVDLSKRIESSSQQYADQSGLGGQVALIAGNTASQLGQMYLMGPEEASATLAAANMSESAFPRAAEIIGEGMRASMHASTIPAVMNAANSYQRVYEQTGDPMAAVKAGVMSGNTTWLANMMPLSVEGPLAYRAFTAGVSGGFSSEFARMANNTAMPGNMQEPFSTEGLVQNVLTTGAIGTILAGHDEQDYQTAYLRYNGIRSAAEAGNKGAVRTADLIDTLSQVSNNIDNHMVDAATAGVATANAKMAQPHAQLQASDPRYAAIFKATQSGPGSVDAATGEQIARDAYANEVSTNVAFDKYTALTGTKAATIQQAKHAAILMQTAHQVVPKPELDVLARWAAYDQPSQAQFNASLEQTIQTKKAPDVAHAKYDADYGEDGVANENAFQRDSAARPDAFDAYYAPNPKVEKAMQDAGINYYRMNDGRLAIRGHNSTYTSAVFSHVLDQTGIKPMQPGETYEKPDTETQDGNGKGVNATEGSESESGQAIGEQDGHEGTGPVGGAGSVIGNEGAGAVAQGSENLTDRAKPVAAALAKAGVSAPISNTGRVTIEPGDAHAQDIIDAAATDAAEHPESVRKPLTDGQKASGNYPVAKVLLTGKGGDLAVDIENPIGSVRRSLPGQKSWSRPMKDAHYGRFPGTISADGEPLDVLLTRHAHDDTLPIAVIAQHDPVTGKFDEPKVVMGTKTKGQALSIYGRQYPTGMVDKLAPGGKNDVVMMSRAKFAKWKDSGATDVMPHPVSGAPLLSLRRMSAFEGDTGHANIGEMTEKVKAVNGNHGTDLAYDPDSDTVSGTIPEAKAAAIHKSLSRINGYAGSKLDGQPIAKDDAAGSGQESSQSGGEASGNGNGMGRPERSVRQAGSEVPESPRGEGAENAVSDAPIFHEGKSAHPVSAVGVHYSNTKGLKSLDPTMAGTGSPGAERRSKGFGNYGKRDPMNAVTSFYVRNGKELPSKEASVLGTNPYEARLNNLYDINNDPDGIYSDAVKNGTQGNRDAILEAIHDHGYDGYLYDSLPGQPKGRVATVFGVHGKIPVKDVGTAYLGKGDKTEGRKLFKDEADERKEKRDKIKEALADKAADATKERTKDLRAEAEEQTETPEFKHWFGESKTVDAKGKPITLYHGTSKDADFKSFKMGRRGVWLTADPKVASEYAKDNDSKNLRYNPSTRNFDKLNAADRVMPVFARIEKPYVMTQADHDSMNQPNYAKAQRDFFDQLVKKGYDGVEYGHDTWVALGEKDQIKSAIGNKGTFSKKSADLRFTFATEKAHGADLGALERAKATEAENKGSMTQRNIDAKNHIETGWSRGADGHWRYEISDWDAEAINEKKLSPEDQEQIKTQEGVPIEKVLKHDKLFAAYPQVKQIHVSTMRGLLGPHSGAMYDTDTKTIYMHPFDKYSGLVGHRPDSIMLHEIQHFLQYDQGHAQGGNSAEFIKEIKAEKAEKIKILTAEIAAAPEGAKTEKLQQQLDELKSATDADVAKESLERYKRLAGEQEAYNTEGRSNLSDEERAALPPEFTETTPRSLQIIRYKKGGGNESITGADDEVDGRTTEETAAGTKASGLQGRGRVSGSDGGLETERTAPDEARPVAGLPEKVKVNGKVETFGPVARAIKAAHDYAKEAGIDYHRPDTYAKVDEARATRIAAEFERMEHAPNDPEVKKAYKAMVDETLAQWKVIKATGLKIEFIKPDQPDPYGNPRNAILDVRDNNHLWVYPTDSGFGSSDKDVSDNPLLKPTGETIDGHKMLANDVFRIVHDYFGHIKEGFGFRAEGEENAWRSHSEMYSPLARRAMTSETRGQNSWVNYGPHGEANRTASGADTHYADQKVGLMPEWTSHEGSPSEEREQAERGQDVVPANARSAFKDKQRQASVIRGNKEADSLGLRDAAHASIGDNKHVTSIEFVHDESGLPSDLRDTVLQRTKGKAGLEGLFDPESGKVYILTKAVRTPERAAWVAAHEIAGHKGFRAWVAAHPDVRIAGRPLEDVLNEVTDRALTNPTVGKMADAITQARDVTGRREAGEEALAELSAASRTNDWDRIGREYGVNVPSRMRQEAKGVLGAFMRTARKIVDAITSKITGKPRPFTDDQVRQLIEDSHKQGAADEQARALKEARDAGFPDDTAPLLSMVSRLLRRQPVTLATEPRAPGESDQKWRMRVMLKARGGMKAAVRLQKALDETRQTVGRQDMRAMFAELDRKSVIAEKSFHNVQAAFDKVPDADNLKAMDQWETGQAVTSPEHAAFFNAMKAGFDDRIQAIENLKPGGMTDLIQNYMPHIWTDPLAARGWADTAIGKRPLSGPKSFMKQRHWPTIKEGMDSGLKPVSTNPVDMVLRRFGEMDKYIGMLKLQDTLKDRGWMKRVNAGQKPPDGFDLVNDSAFNGSHAYIEKGLTPADDKARTARWSMAVPKGIARDINNYLMPGLNKYKGWRAFRAVENGIVQSQLGWSGFHAGFTTLENLTLHLSSAISRFTDGDIAGGMGTLLKAPLSIITSPIEGHMLNKAWRDPSVGSPETQAILRALEEGGAHQGMSSSDFVDAIPKLMRDIRRGDYGKAALHTLPAVGQASSWLIHNWLVPNQKMSARVTLFKQMLDHYAGKLGKDRGDYQGILGEMSPMAMRQIAGKVVDLVDDRLGQMNYDNQFWNTNARMAGQASVLSLGWLVGEVRTVTGGLAGIPSAWRPEKLLGSLDKAGRINSATMPKVDFRTVYLGVLASVMSGVDALMQKAMTGKGPTEIKDLFYPKTGQKNPDGSDERLALPSYWKDHYELATHPLKTLSHKINPIFGMLYEALVSNQDYYGTEIRNPHSSIAKQALQTGEFFAKNFMPYSVGAAQKSMASDKSTGRIIGNMFGVNNASADASRSDFQAFVAGNGNKGYSSQSMTQAQTDHMRAMAAAEFALRSNKPPDWSHLSQKDRVTAIKAARLEKPEQQFKKLDFPDKLEAWDKATPKERDDYHLLQDLRKTDPRKSEVFKRLDEDEQAAYLKRYREILRGY